MSARSLALVLGLALLGPVAAARAQLPLPLHAVPLLAGGGGAGSEITVANLSSRAVTVGLRFFPEGQPNSFDGAFPKTLTLARGETRSFPGETAIPPASTPGTRGWLLVADATPVDCSSLDWPYPALLAVSSRFRRGGGEAVVDPDWLRVNVTASPSVIAGLPGVSVPATRRQSVEVGVTNLSTLPLPVRIDLIDGAGGTLRSVERTVPALSLALWPLAALAAPGAPAPARVDVTGAPGADPCALALLPPPCVEPCDRAACPQRYRLPAAPAFVAFALTGSGGELTYRAGVVDWVGAQRAATMVMSTACPQARPAARILDLFGKLVLLHEPPAIRKVEPAP